MTLFKTQKNTLMSTIKKPGERELSLFNFLSNKNHNHKVMSEMAVRHFKI